MSTSDLLVCVNEFNVHCSTYRCCDLLYVELSTYGNDEAIVLPRNQVGSQVVKFERSCWNKDLTIYIGVISAYDHVSLRLVGEAHYPGIYSCRRSYSCIGSRDASEGKRTEGVKVNFLC